MRKSLKNAVIATLSYSNHFRFPLTKQELYSRLIQIKTTKKELSDCLEELVKEGKVSSQSGYFFLPKQEELVSRRRLSAKVSTSKRKLAVYYAHKISQIPWVVAIFLTGSLAVNNAKQKDDIDFMIITRSRRLWLTRLFLTTYLDFLALRRKPHETLTQNKLCLNLYLTSTSLTIPRKIRSLYTAYELIQAKPVYDPDRIAPQLLQHNSWLNSHLPNYSLPRSTSSAQNPKKTWLDILESLAYKLELGYMKKRITREYISQDRAFFHPQNPSLDLIAKINQILNPK